ncbi:MAG TPA: hypothetical protein VLE74_02580 [Candidatus Saccharimonadales bacterium]|nr:hypothetical protein [Candidatus Saccharimonadales bacterium]
MQIHKKSLLYFIGGAFLLAAALFLLTHAARAATPSYDPYADSVASSSTGVVNADNAVGAPNGTFAQMAGLNSILTLDMGSGEEGTQSLRIYFGQISAVVNVSVDFLDSNMNVISSESRQLGVDPNPSTQNFAYNWTNFGKAYRFVRISSAQLGASVNVDAVEALGYIGSTPTQDTDGDGVPDRTEQTNGTDPLVPNPRPSSGGGGTTTLPASLQAGSTSNGASAQVNPPPAASNDKDGDGMPDDWELAHGLNPADKTDAAKDPDHDGLNNLTEYQIGSDPQKYDTDGDGMPDGWEYKNGLDVNKNDANGDPDGDFLTNLGEYRHNTDPNKADDLYKVFGTNCKPSRKNITGLEWFWIVLLLAGAAGSWVLAFLSGRKAKRTANP